MYNQKQKIHFIQEHSDKISVRELCTALFNSICQFEEDAGMDISCMSTDQISSIVDKVSSSVRGSSTSVKSSMFRAYFKWCVSNSTPGVNTDSVNFMLTDRDKMKECTVANPKHLQRFLDALFVKEEEQTMDNIYRACFWLVYSGVNEEDLVKLTDRDIDLDDMSVLYKGQRLPLFRESLKCIRNCINLTSLVYIHPLYSDKIVVRQRYPGNNLIRGIKANASLPTMRVEFSSRNKEAIRSGATELKLSLSRVSLSGLFYRMLEDELAGFDPDFSRYVDVRYDSSSDARKKVIKRSLSADYERWKQVWNR